MWLCTRYTKGILSWDVSCTKVRQSVCLHAGTFDTLNKDHPEKPILTFENNAYRTTPHTRPTWRYTGHNNCGEHWGTWHVAGDGSEKEGHYGFDTWRERNEYWETPSCRVTLRGKDNEKVVGWCKLVKEWTCLNEMWSEEEDRVAWRQIVRRVAPMDWLV